VEKITDIRFESVA